MPYQYGGCQADSVQHGHYDAGGYCSGGVDKNCCQSVVLKEPNWGPEQRTVHALDQDADRQGQDGRGCNEVEAPKKQGTVHALDQDADRRGQDMKNCG